MKEIRLLHTADVHLDRSFSGYPGNKGTLRRNDIRDKFQQVMRLAEQENSDVLLIAGDLFDTNSPSRSTVELVKSEFEKLKSKDIRVFITPGTHDCLEGGSVWNAVEFPENVHVFKSENFSCVSVPGLNLTVYGAADETGNSDRRIMKSLSIDRSNAYENIVVMVHGSVQLPWLKNDNYFPISREELNAAEAAYVALGITILIILLTQEQRRHIPARRYSLILRKTGRSTCSWQGFPEMRLK